MQVEIRQLKNFLIDANLISEEQFADCLKESRGGNKNIEEVLVAQGIVTEDELAKLKAYIIGIPFVNLENEVVPRDILNLIPEDADPRLIPLMPCCHFATHY